jgi:membrane-associated phospholipid phosphatase
MTNSHRQHFWHIVLCLMLLVAFLLVSPPLIRSSSVNHFDQKIYEFNQAHLVSPWVEFMKKITHLGDGKAMLGFSALFCYVAYRRKDKKIAGWIAGGAIATGLGGWAIKEWVERLRPESHLGFARGFSFPSGHAKNIAFVVTVFLWVFANRSTPSPRRTLFIIFAVFVGLFVGLSRIVLEFHWFTDVIAGYIFGTLMALTFRELSLITIPSPWTGEG